MNIEFSQQVSSDSENEGENRALQPPSQEEEVIIRDLVSINNILELVIIFREGIDTPRIIFIWISTGSLVDYGR